MIIQSVHFVFVPECTPICVSDDMVALPRMAGIAIVIGVKAPDLAELSIVEVVGHQYRTRVIATAEHGAWMLSIQVGYCCQETVHAISVAISP